MKLPTFRMVKKLLLLVSILLVAYFLPLRTHNTPSAAPSPSPSPAGTPIAAPAPAPKGACYIWGEACQKNLTKEECKKKGWVGDDLPPFSFWKEGAACYDKLEVAVEQASIDCKGRDLARDAAKIADEVHKKCLEELKEKEAREAANCTAKGEVLSVAYRLPGGWVYNPKLEQCVGSCAAILQCIDPKDSVWI